MSKTVTVSDTAHQVIMAIGKVSGLTQKQIVDQLITKHLAEHLELLQSIAPVEKRVKRTPNIIQKKAGG